VNERSYHFGQKTAHKTRAVRSSCVSFEMLVFLLFYFLFFLHCHRTVTMRCCCCCCCCCDVPVPTYVGILHTYMYVCHIDRRYSPRRSWWSKCRTCDNVYGRRLLGSHLIQKLDYIGVNPTDPAIPTVGYERLHDIQFVSER